MHFVNPAEQAARRRRAAAIRALAHARREHTLATLTTYTSAGALLGYTALAGPGAVESWQHHQVSDLGFVAIAGILTVALICATQWMIAARRAVHRRALTAAAAQRAYDITFTRMIEGE